MGNTTQFKYDAFISYKHEDKAYAVELQKALGTYTIPQTLRKNDISKKLNIFRDEEEFSAASDLSQEIKEALQQSRYLIVVCSPRTPKSKWVKREIQIFKELGREKQILTVLVEGEPLDAFPTSLRSTRKIIVKENGVEVSSEETIEPLAADVRGSLKRLKIEKFRLIGPITGCEYSKLKKAYISNKIIKWLSITSVVVLISIVLLYTFIWKPTLNSKSTRGQHTNYISEVYAESNLQLITNDLNNEINKYRELIIQAERSKNRIKQLQQQMEEFESHVKETEKGNKTLEGINKTWSEFNFK